MARASIMACSWEPLRRVMAERLRKPSAMTESRTNRLTVTTKAKPLRCEAEDFWGFMARIAGLVITK